LRTDYLENHVTDDELDDLAEQIALWQAHAPSDERETALDLIEMELARLSTDDQAAVLRRLGR
jgi:hypothetical protein